MSRSVRSKGEETEGMGTHFWVDCWCFSNSAKCSWVLQLSTTSISFWGQVADSFETLQECHEFYEELFDILDKGMNVFSNRFWKTWSAPANIVNQPNKYLCFRKRYDRTLQIQQIHLTHLYVVISGNSTARSRGSSCWFTLENLISIIQIKT